MDRWQGAFATANHAGIACAVVLVAMVSVLATRKPGTLWRFPDGWLLWMIAVAAFSGLVASQSRAAVVAVFGAWLLAGCPGGRPVRIVAALAAIATCGWLLWARGMSAIPGSHDVSTIHHLRLWADACGVAVANPLSGCGWGDFGRLWQEWLEPPAWKFGFTSALSTPLTLLAEIGLLAGFPLLAVLAMPACAPADTPTLRAAPSDLDRRVDRRGHLLLSARPIGHRVAVARPWLVAHGVGDQASRIVVRPAAPPLHHRVGLDDDVLRCRRRDGMVRHSLPRHPHSP